MIEALNRNTTNKNFVFCTDSKSVLYTLKNLLIVSKLVKDCIQFHNLLCSENSVTVMKVPTHCDIEGNEIADSLAKLDTGVVLNVPDSLSIN